MAARLFWQAFRGKLGRIMWPEQRALGFIGGNLDPQFALAARDHHGTLLGLAGFKDRNGALLGGDFRSLAASYGWFGAFWRGALLELLERDIEPDVLLMDGIFVSQAARGRGIGTALLRAICDTARARNLSAVRLDVIDTNPRARALYAREGFVEIDTQDIGLLRLLLNFRTSTRMQRNFADPM
ncbi:GNAT family N-acetyltransferase [Microbulbifer sp. S227A]|uniref:GNAT family N-acetyltransferase n=1 Tax=Microbulbifer sp. S227A TaxID=3415131 RepID=UPI003C7A1E5A